MAVQLLHALWCLIGHYIRPDCVHGPSHLLVNVSLDCLLLLELFFIFPLLIVQLGGVL